MKNIENLRAEYKAQRAQFVKVWTRNEYEKVFCENEGWDGEEELQSAAYEAIEKQALVEFNALIAKRTANLTPTPTAWVGYAKKLVATLN